jgi:phospholipid-binding lipoprotein MlaA
VRDSAGLVADRQMAPSVLFGAESDRYAMTTLEVVHGRAVLLGTTALLSSVALDKYSFTREAWLSRRQDQIFDGAPPIETFEDIGDSNPAPSPAK